MDNVIDKIKDLETRLKIVEEVLGIDTQKMKYQPKPKQPKPEPQPENEVNGFGKDQLKVMFNWAKSMKLNQITKRDFDELKKWGMLWEFYPDAPEFYEEIKR